MIPQLQRETPVSSQDNASIQWSQTTKIAFRFVSSYFLLYIGPGAVGSLSSYMTKQDLDSRIWSRIWHPIVPWVGTHLLNLTGNFNEIPNGSGDQLYDYVLIVCMVLAAIVSTAIWSVLDRKRPNYRQLYQWLRLFMRMVACWAMLGYGIKKLVGAQFPPPDLSRLLQPVGQVTPMGMLWTFMGASALYSFFGGLGEVMGGLLLMVPRLATLGALVSGAVMTNVLMLNLCYDVPRKIFCIHLLLMFLFLLIPDFRRLGDVFIFNRPVEAAPQPPLFEDKPLNRIALAAQVAFAMYVLWVAGAQSLKDGRDLRASVPAPIRGVWSVTDFTKDGMLRPPLVSDQERWGTLVFDGPKLLTVIFLDGTRERYYMQFDSALNSAKLWDVTEHHAASLSLATPSSTGQMTLSGQIDGHPVTAKLERVNTSDPEKYPLMNRSLRWVDPAIDNR